MAVALGGTADIVTGALSLAPRTAVVAPERVVLVWPIRNQARRDQRGLATRQEVDAWRTRRGDVFSDVAVVRPCAIDSCPHLVTDPHGPRVVRAAEATPNLFALLGASAAQGRLFSGEDATADDGVIISDAFWRGPMASAPLDRLHVLLRSHKVGAIRSLRVVGVLAPTVRLDLPYETDLWIPVPWSAFRRDVAELEVAFHVVGRLQPGVTLPAARGALAYMGTVRTDAESVSGPDVLLERFDDYLFRATRPLVAGIVSGTVICVAACSLAAGLLWITFVKRHESAWCVTGALGAQPWQLIADWATSFFCGSGIVAVGALLTSCCLGLVTDRVAPRPDSSYSADLTRYLALLWSAGPLVLVAGVLSFGEFRHVAYRSSFNVSTDGLASNGRATARWPVALQASLVSALLVGAVVASLLLAQTARADLGVTVRGVRYLRVSTLDESTLTKYFAVTDEIRAALKPLGSVAIASRLPVGEAGRERGVNRPPDAVGGPAILRVIHQQVDGNYFRTLGITLIAGRGFAAADTIGAPPVAIISRSLARQWFGAKEAVGRRFRFGGRAVQVIGVAPDIRRSLHEDPKPTLYSHIYQDPSIGFVVLLRSDVETAQEALRGTVARLMPNEGVLEEGSLQSRVDREFAEIAILARSGGYAAALSVCVFIIALIPTCAHVRATRAQELRIRAALGATPRRLQLYLFRRIAEPVMAGASAGVLAGGLALTVTRSQVFEASAVTSGHLLAGCAVALLLTFAATCVSVGTAAAVDPGRRALGSRRKVPWAP